MHGDPLEIHIARVFGEPRQNFDLVVDFDLPHPPMNVRFELHTTVVRASTIERAYDVSLRCEQVSTNMPHAFERVGNDLYFRSAVDVQHYGVLDAILHHFWLENDSVN